MLGSLFLAGEEAVGDGSIGGNTAAGDVGLIYWKNLEREGHSGDQHVEIISC